MTRKPPSAMPIVSFSIEPEQEAFISRLAQELRVPKSRIFREAIRRFMGDPSNVSIIRDVTTDDNGKAA